MKEIWKSVPDFEGLYEISNLGRVKSLPKQLGVRWREDERILEVHHIDENRSNNEITNLIILCPICHRYISLSIYTLSELKNKYK